ncbi:MAG TPA: hypothetical protein VFN87_07045 [Solirubrobacteraceae bacterium]|nr:hypothetical protein [Solirubrobacteraceae bacterium]
MRWRHRRERGGGARPAAPFAELRLRRAQPDDTAAIARLAELDGAPVPASPVLVTEAGGELWVAVSLVSLEHVAHPFRPSGEVVELALARARQMRAGGGPIRGRGTGVPGLRDTVAGELP